MVNSLSFSLLYLSLLSLSLSLFSVSASRPELLSSNLWLTNNTVLNQFFQVGVVSKDSLVVN
jgi:hypothetical protein